jgi:hypothetical protein
MTAGDGGLQSSTQRLSRHGPLGPACRQAGRGTYRGRRMPRRLFNQPPNTPILQHSMTCPATGMLQTSEASGRSRSSAGRIRERNIPKGKRGLAAPGTPARGVRRHPPDPPDKPSRASPAGDCLLMALIAGFFGRSSARPGGRRPHVRDLWSCRAVIAEATRFAAPKSRAPGHVPHLVSHLVAHHVVPGPNSCRFASFVGGLRLSAFCSLLVAFRGCFRRARPPAGAEAPPPVSESETSRKASGGSLPPGPPPEESRLPGPLG